MEDVLRAQVVTISHPLETRSASLAQHKLLAIKLPFPAPWASTKMALAVAYALQERITTRSVQNSVPRVPTIPLAIRRLSRAKLDSISARQVARFAPREPSKIPMVAARTAQAIHCARTILSTVTPGTRHSGRNVFHVELASTRVPSGTMLAWIALLGRFATEPSFLAPLDINCLQKRVQHAWRILSSVRLETRPVLFAQLALPATPHRSLHVHRDTSQGNWNASLLPTTTIRLQQP